MHPAAAVRQGRADAAFGAAHGTGPAPRSRRDVRVRCDGQSGAGARSVRQGAAPVRNGDAAPAAGGPPGG